MRVKNMVTEQEVLKRWEEIQNDDERILFIVGGPGSGKSKIIRTIAEEKGWRYLEAKDLLDEEFLEMARELRPQLAKDAICKALNSCNSEVVLIDSVEVLFAPILNLDPIALLRAISTVHPIMVGWRGHLDGNTLHLEHRNNPNYFTVEISDPNHVITVA